MPKQIGLSPKLLAPIFTALTAVAASTITTGDLNRPELAVLAVAVIGAVAAYIAPAGEVETPGTLLAPIMTPTFSGAGAAVTWSTPDMAAAAKPETGSDAALAEAGVLPEDLPEVTS